jgi:hypothetical protein
VRRFGGRLHHAEPVEFPLSLCHKSFVEKALWRERNCQSLLLGCPGPGRKTRTPLSNWIVFPPHEGANHSEVLRVPARGKTSSGPSSLPPVRKQARGTFAPASVHSSLRIEAAQRFYRGLLIPLRSGRLGTLMRQETHEQLKPESAQ